MSDRIEVLATVLLGLAALATAWSSYAVALFFAGMTTKLRRGP